jgi:hypothetical protein
MSDHTATATAEALAEFHCEECLQVASIRFEPRDGLAHRRHPEAVERLVWTT